MEVYHDEAADKVLSCARPVLYASPLFGETTYNGTYKLPDGRFIERHLMEQKQKIYVLTPQECSEQLRSIVARQISHASP